MEREVNITIEIDKEQFKEKLNLSNGKDGKDGESIVGPAGKNGKDGKDGESIVGPAGKDAEDVTPYDIIEVLKKERSLDISHIRNGEALASAAGKLAKLNMSDMRWHGGGKLVTKDANGNIVEQHTKAIGFTGSGVVAVTTDHAGGVTVLISGGGGSSPNFTDSEVVSGLGTSFTLANTPIVGSVHLYARGQRLTPVTDYSITGTAITTVRTWLTGNLLADYRT
jgi:hypothetical protein